MTIDRCLVDCLRRNREGRDWCSRGKLFEQLARWIRLGDRYDTGYAKGVHRNRYRLVANPRCMADIPKHRCSYCSDFEGSHWTWQE